MASTGRLTPPFTFEQLADEVEGLRQTLAGGERLFSDRIIDDTELKLTWFALQPLYFETFDPDAVLESTRTLICHADAHNALYVNKDQYDVRDRLHEIEVPTLLIVGEIRDFLGTR